MAARAQLGDMVRIRCTTKDANGAVIESTEASGLLQVKLGEDQIPECIEKALIGMRPGDRLASTFGPFAFRHDELVYDVERDDLPEKASAQVGEALTLQYANGKVRTARVTQVSESSVTLDANHPLAGKKLFFNIELVDIV